MRLELNRDRLGRAGLSEDRPVWTSASASRACSGFLPSYDPSNQVWPPRSPAAMPSRIHGPRRRPGRLPPAMIPSNAEFIDAPSAGNISTSHSHREAQRRRSTPMYSEAQTVRHFRRAATARAVLRRGGPPLSRRAKSVRGRPARPAALLDLAFVWVCGARHVLLSFDQVERRSAACPRACKPGVPSILTTAGIYGLAELPQGHVGLSGVLARRPAQLILAGLLRLRRPPPLGIFRGADRPRHQGAPLYRASRFLACDALPGPCRHHLGVHDTPRSFGLINRSRLTATTTPSTGSAIRT